MKIKHVQLAVRVNHIASPKSRRKECMTDNKLYKWLVGAINEYLKDNPTDSAYVVGTVEMVKDTILERIREEEHEQPK